MNDVANKESVFDFMMKTRTVCATPGTKQKTIHKRKNNGRCMSIMKKKQAMRNKRKHLDIVYELDDIADTNKTVKRSNACIPNNNTHHNHVMQKTPGWKYGHSGMTDGTQQLMKNAQTSSFDILERQRIEGKNRKQLKMQEEVAHLQGLSDHMHTQRGIHTHDSSMSKKKHYQQIVSIRRKEKSYHQRKIWISAYLGLVYPQY